MTLSIVSPSFDNGGEIPEIYTCEGRDISPALSWSGVPPATRSLVLIVDDPDAPDPKAPRMTWVHWVVFNMPPALRGLAEGAGSGRVPGAADGINDWKRPGYGGPCPPIGRHRYFHKLYALDAQLEGLKAPTKAEVVAAMQGHVLAEAVLLGTYQKKR